MLRPGLRPSPCWLHNLIFSYKLGSFFFFFSQGGCWGAPAQSRGSSRIQGPHHGSEGQRAVGTRPPTSWFHIMNTSWYVEMWACCSSSSGIICGPCQARGRGVGDAARTSAFSSPLPGKMPVAGPEQASGVATGRLCCPEEPEGPARADCCGAETGSSTFISLTFSPDSGRLRWPRAGHKGQWLRAWQCPCPLPPVKGDRGGFPQPRPTRSSSSVGEKAGSSTGQRGIGVGVGWASLMFFLPFCQDVVRAQPCAGKAPGEGR